MSLPSRRTCRTAFAVVLLLATQLAFAGQFCAAVVTGSAQGGRQMTAAANSGDITSAVAAEEPCCGGMAMPVGTCVTAFGGMSLAALAPGSVSLPDLIPLVRDRSPLASGGAASASVVVLTTSAGPPLPAYILLRRFLS